MLWMANLTYVDPIPKTVNIVPNQLNCKNVPESLLDIVKQLIAVQTKSQVGRKQTSRTCQVLSLSLMTVY